MSHLGQRLSALIDGELDGAERDRVLVHLAKCESCRGEVLALRTLKRRMSALGGAAADGALTRRLMGLAQQETGFGRPGFGQPGFARPGDKLGPSGPVRSGAFPPADWPRFATAPAGSPPWPQSRPGWYAGAGAIVLLASLGTAVFMAGGTAQRPGPQVTPSVDTYYVQHEIITGTIPAQAPAAVLRAPRPAASAGRRYAPMTPGRAAAASRPSTSAAPSAP